MLRNLHGAFMRNHDEIYGDVAALLGDEGAQYALSVAQLDDFAEFKKSMIRLGYPVYDYDYRKDGNISRSSQFANCIIALRYPFAVSYGKYPTLFTIQDKKPLFLRTFLDGMPRGWQAAFGLEICEDIDAALRGYDDIEAANSYVVTEVEEKWGTLRWRCGFLPDGCDPEKGYKECYPLLPRRDRASDDKLLCDILDAYRMFSSYICAECGSLFRVSLSTRGNIIPKCQRCWRSEYDFTDCLEWCRENKIGGPESAYGKLFLSNIIEDAIIEDTTKPMPFPTDYKHFRSFYGLSAENADECLSWARGSGLQIATLLSAYDEAKTEDDGISAKERLVKFLNDGDGGETSSQ